MTQYAANTSVSVDKSISEIKRTLDRYGASQFGYAEDSIRGMASIQFCASGRHIQFMLHLPCRDSEDFTMTETGRQRKSDAALKSWEQACRQRWRALSLCIKAKLEAVECGITEFDDEFMAHIVLPGGGTVGQLMRPQIEHAYLTGDKPAGISGFLSYSETD